ncbi:TPA: phage tail protein [Yersinia enterocolitica]|uniref:Tail fiber protein n=1 Tax=Yersinia phage vB_YenM_56.17 TaxID=2918927 RepID=A0AAE9JWU6_9CAUD|nr:MULTISPECIES: phage tail protein [Yersinia]YP_010664300.1 tail fiber protein [Yersinia phage vB_YenM_56.17]ELI8050993.1 phage tail protein [Yersinia enterocolitica]MCE3065153.1 phage tail protein [Yersinia enterocolitica]UNA05928.1 tail fiber protein [Yersinia phage vB_YenM_56.17]UYJ82431.1 phage tail protein [Yersinia enterocolitica]CQH62982.1 tail fiber protein [Yersinia enterocolitica]
MTARFFALLTNIGAAKLANATTLGTRLEITQMAVGDGGGTLPTPNPAQTKLVNEQRRAALNMLTIDPINTSQIIAEQVIPETEGGWWIREIGLLDKDGDLVAIANCAETYKPQLQEGSGRTQTIRMILIVSSTAAVTLKIDPSVVLATRKYADDKAIEVKQYADNLLTEHEKSRNHPDASKTEKGFVKLSSATTSDSEVLAATPKAVKTVAEAAAKALGDHGKDANPHDQYFQIANLLSEIKALGPAALAETLANLGLGDAAKKGIATNAEMQVGTADKLVSLVGLISIFGKRTFTANDYIRIPDVPGGFIVQFGTATTLASGDTIVTFPIPFPNKVLGIHPSQNNSYTNGAWAAYASKSLSSFALSGWTNATTRIAISVDYFAVGY